MIKKLVLVFAILGAWLTVSSQVINWLNQYSLMPWLTNYLILFWWVIGGMLFIAFMIGRIFRPHTQKV